MKNNHQWLIELRTKKNMTHDSVAQLTDITRSYYTKIENGVVPSVRVAKRIAQVLGFDWSRFYEEEYDKEGESVLDK
ncbi:helix-turn-helix transcriptional regulator [Brevibacillus dissolubilis]|uniref:helix-turn-helix transcriptional regulator n=1 Tax=Brevibacillus dissolubilis TaxID=1844116 RepID=UPI001115E066|nr:helix-turn-helix transcriptional regulator [Brevibacillus dissolubilis]